MRVPWIVYLVPWPARRSNQSILKEINPEYSLEELMLKLKLQYYDHLTRRADSLEQTLMLGGIGGKRRGTTEDEAVGWHHQLEDVSLRKLQESVMDRETQGASAHGAAERQTQLSN